eukprot:TRINITY_DN497_c1_g1_i4.p1 TRINITY_DN497_c1_g1~~TRINITY_DN497_c1_g1_i4.p1  ORF type:complete len:773 (-),score=124.62 TRINITY_DN497_c1_g1_i4:468-2615(-)
MHGKAEHVRSPSLDAAIENFDESLNHDTESKLQISDDADAKYVRIAFKQMVGVYLSIWVKKQIVDKIRGIQTMNVATGVFGYLGNKGAVAIRMRIYDSSVLFVTCHLPSGESSSDLLKRNVDFAEILKRCQFYQPEAASTKEGQWYGISAIMQHEHIVWMGDFNYRINLEANELREALRADRFDRLLAKDELLIEMDKGTIIHGFTEGILSFPPTFKFKRRTNQYLGEEQVAELDEIDDESNNHNNEDTAASKEKVRRPAWTDRILFKSKGGLHQLQYNCGDLTLSDHRPVYAAFLLFAKEYDRELVMQSIDLARKARDAKEMAAVPSCHLEPSNGQITLGEVKYSEPNRQQISIQNTGEVPAIFKFIAVPGSEDISPPWLQITPHSSLLEPQTTQAITLTVHVTGGEGSSAQEVVDKCQGKLEAILVLRVEGGRDFFVTVQGQFTPSFFGLSLDTVMQLNKKYTEAARQLIDVDGSSKDLNSEMDEVLRQTPMRERDEVLQHVPLQIKQLVVYLTQKDRLQTPGLIVDSISMCNMYDFGGVDGSETKAFRSVRIALDNRQPLDQVLSDDQAHLAAALLLVMFRSLPCAFMPNAATQMCNVMVPAPQEAANLLAAEMTTVEWAVLRFMLNLMRKILAQSAANGVNAELMSQTMANIWFPPLADPLSEAGQQEGGGVGDNIQEQLLIKENVTQTRTEFVQQFLFPQRRQMSFTQSG